MGNPNNIFVAQMARLWLAAVGVAAPAGPAVVMPTGWRDAGLFTPDSLTFSSDLSTEEVRSHQSAYPTRRFHPEASASFGVDLQEWLGENIIAVFGGGTIATVAAVTGPPAIPQHYRFSPPAIGGRQTVQACIEIIDGTKNYRRIIPRCEQAEGVEQSFARTSESTLPIRMSVLGSDVGDPFYDLSNDPAWAPAA